MPKITLTPTQKKDLRYFFEFQRDPEACYLAAFTSQDPNNKAAYLEKWEKLLLDPSIQVRTIKVGRAIAGSVGKYESMGEAQITYWLDRKCWGKGIATAALQAFLEIETSRPMYGRVAFDNYGSQRVLEKCGFVKIGTETDFANARQAAIEEYVYQLGE
ncbi:Protein N-acetyltransferase, RimJ/RimL family [Flexibacter flexilis DSM 6793]|uniref:Protein N-acetyltransferase, RimJ/RimL family n=1 Tax=Flexibacter flexilis DSM 6793 TaxID=927664 RepID=A0A1I1F6U5_9BACT|nr:GNAT family N-acetyltransferase [Flexibacter flexilis]SFB95021.1 Protein N-acetyltransferase, RimJ/RimL family [Flexibacter flexilis DSM 6793]